MPKRYLLPFGSFAPDAQEFDSSSLDVADNALPVFGSLRPLQQKSVISSAATTGAVTGSHSHLLLSTEQIQYGRPVSDVGVGVWRGVPGGLFTNLYALIDEATASDADYIVNGAPSGGSSAEFRLTSLATPGSDAHTMRWRYKVSSYSATAASVTSITRAGAVATVTTAAAHGLATGDTIVIAGATQTEYNGSHAFTSTGATTGTFAVSGTPASPATGTITWKEGWYIKAELLEGSTVRATSTVRGSADADWTATDYTLTAGEYAAITAYTDLRIKFTTSVPGVAQELLPSSDSENAGGWTTATGATTALYAEIDESSPDDATTYIKTPSLAAGAGSRSYTAALASGSDPMRNSGNALSYRYKATNSGITLKVSLMQGETEVASDTITNASTSWTTGTKTLSSSEYLAVTDWSDLSVRFRGSYPSVATSTETQTSLPDEDIENSGGWTGDTSPLYTNLDEAVADDGDSVSSGTSVVSPGVAETLTLGLASVEDPGIPSDHVLKVRCRRAGTPSPAVRVALMQGSDVIADFNGLDSAPAAFTTLTYTLSSAQADAITDYSNLRVRLTRNSDEAGVVYSWAEFSVPQPRQAHVSWAELETLSLARGQVSWFELQIPDPNNTYNADAQEIYAGTETAIYEVTSSSGFSDVSVAGGYATSGDTPHPWSMTSWGGDVIATNYIDEVQSRAAGAALFGNLVTSTERPSGRFVTVIGPHVVLGDIINTGGTITGHGDMVWWSAIDDAADFDPDPATQCDYQRLRGTPGQLMGIVGGIDYGLVFKRNSIYRMTYFGAPLIFGFEALSTQVGTPSPRSIVRVDDDVYFWTGNTFAALRGGGELDTTIGDGVVLKMLKDYSFEDRSIEQAQDADQRVMDAIMFGAYDKFSGLIAWCYRHKGGTVYRNDKVLFYNPRANTWGYASDSSLDCADLLSQNNVMSDDTHLLKGLVGFSYDGTNSNWWKFKSGDTYAMTLTSKVISAQAITSSERRGGADIGVALTGVRPAFQGEPGASTDPVITVAITPSAEPLMQDAQSVITATTSQANSNGVCPVSRPVVGEYFRFTTTVPSLFSQTIKDMPGLELFYEDAP